MAAALRALLLVSLALPLAGCGAAMSSYLIIAAQIDVDAAEAAEAEQYAPYEYTAAQEYLHKAREEQGYADFGPAIEYAFMAQEFAEKAVSRAKKVKAQQQPPPGAPLEPEAPPAPEPAPAEGIIIRKKPEAAPSPQPPSSPTPAPEAAEPELELVPPSPDPGAEPTPPPGGATPGAGGPGSDEGGEGTSDDESPEPEIAPVPPPASPSPQGG